MNIRSLDDINKKKNASPEDDSDDEKKEKRTTFIGGEKSGLLVEDNSNPNDKLINLAKKSGTKSGSSKGGPQIKLSLYQNGIYIAELDRFYSFSEPEGQAIMKDLLEGRVPVVLQKEFKGDMDVGVEDRRKEVYEKKEVKNPFQGEGISMSDPNYETKIKDMKISEVKLSLDKNQPVHELQIKFPNGEKRVVSVNPDTKFNVIRDLVQIQLKTNSFKIVTPPFPVRDVTQETKTLGELDLLDSSITVSMA